MKSKVIIVSGPTACGKTKISIEIAKALQNQAINAEIVNFDSLLFYKEISIGTAKPDLVERAGVSHHMLDVASINEPINASNFIRRAQNIISDLLQNDTTVVLVGGSAFYLRALLKGMYESTSPKLEIKQSLNLMYKEKGIEEFIEFLKNHDPQSLIDLHRNDHYRLIRAVEHYQTTGTRISDQKKKMDTQNPYDFSKIIHEWKILNIYLDLPKDQHFEIICKRTQSMFDLGIMDEIDNLFKEGFTLDEKPLQSIGYKEAIEFKKGLFITKQQCIDRICISTRQLAKAQRTFFKKISPKESFNPVTDQDKIIERVFDFMKE